MTTKWTKYSFVCNGECDALIEYTFKDGFGWPSGVINLTCPCSSDTTLLSVNDATITPSTTTKEEQMETQYNVKSEAPTPQVMSLDWVENDVVTNKTYTESDVRHMVWVNKNLTNKQNEWFKKESQLRNIIQEVYSDSSDQEVLSQIADIFDISLTKEIEVTVWVRVDATVEVELDGAEFDAVEEFISQNLTIDSYGSELSVNNWEIDRCEEGAY